MYVGNRNMGGYRGLGDKGFVRFKKVPGLGSVSHESFGYEEGMSSTGPRETGWEGVSWDV